MTYLSTRFLVRETILVANLSRVYSDVGRKLRSPRQRHETLMCPASGASTLQMGETCTSYHTILLASFSVRRWLQYRRVTLLWSIVEYNTLDSMHRIARVYNSGHGGNDEGYHGKAIARRRKKTVLDH
jgi:hypothetical protein